MKKLIIDNRDLSYTIDTYGMFTGESASENEYEYYAEEYNLKDDEREKIDFDYDTDGVVETLAEASVRALEKNLINSTYANTLKIVKSIKLIKTKSPQFYNYTTDSYTAEWEVDEDLLNQFIKNNMKQWLEFKSENWSSLDDENADDVTVAMLDFWSQQEYTAEEYESIMFEIESEAWMNNMKPTEDFQKLLTLKEPK